MSFRQRHPYLFWQLIGWGVLLADAGFLVISALCEFGEWSYPIIVFTFIIGLFFVAASPIIVRLNRRRLVPQNTDADMERVITDKLSFVLNVRHGVAADVAMAAGVFGSVIVFIFAAYILGEHVHLALGFVCMVLAIVSPILIIGIYSKRKTRRFFAVQNGEKLVDLYHPDDVGFLLGTNPRTLVFSGEPGAVLLNFFYNWLRFYLKSERLELYRVPAPDLCRGFTPSRFLDYGDILLCIPEEQLDLNGEKEALFKKECDIMSAFPFSVFVGESNAGL